MKILDRSEFIQYKNMHISQIRDGAIFIYPTDTIYGIGCDAGNESVIEKIRELKKRPSQPFSVIAPSKDWIIENCEITQEAKPWLEKLPGPYTLVLKLKTTTTLSPAFNKLDNTVGVRIPNHWISEIVKEINRPIVTTSPNVHGEDVMTDPNHLNPEFKAGVDFTIFEGKLHNPPSSVIKLTDGEEKFLRTR